MNEWGGEGMMMMNTCKLGKSSPAAMAIGEDEVDECLVLFTCPWPFLQSHFLTAWLPSHLSVELINYSVLKHQ